jgi:excisionase family DNA binding protein
MVFFMYVTIPELAEYLSMNEVRVKSLILQGKIRAIHDGKQYLVNKGQFTTYFEQVEKYKLMIQEYLNEPIPEDIDVKDED